MGAWSYRVANCVHAINRGAREKRERGKLGFFSGRVEFLFDKKISYRSLYLQSR